MNNTTIITIFNSDNSNIAYIKTQHFQIMTTITYIILKVESMIKKLIVENHTFFAIVTLSKINSFYRNTVFILSNFQKDFHQYNLPFVCFQLYKYNCLNILADNISCLILVKNQ